MLRLVRLDEIDLVWPVIMPWIERACFKAHSDRTAPQTYAMCRNGSLWLAVACVGPEVGDIVGCSIMSISEVDGDRTLQHVFVAGEGNTDEWFAELIGWDWLTQMGIKRVICEGRAGWPERLKKLVPTIKVVRMVFEWEHGNAG